MSINNLLYLDLLFLVFALIFIYTIGQTFKTFFQHLGTLLFERIFNRRNGEILYDHSNDSRVDIKNDEITPQKLTEPNQSTNAKSKYGFKEFFLYFVISAPLTCIVSLFLAWILIVPFPVFGTLLVSFLYGFWGILNLSQGFAVIYLRFSMNLYPRDLKKDFNQRSNEFRAKRVAGWFIVMFSLPTSAYFMAVHRNWRQIAFDQGLLELPSKFAVDKLLKILAQHGQFW